MVDPKMELNNGEWWKTVIDDQYTLGDWFWNKSTTWLVVDYHNIS